MTNLLVRDVDPETVKRLKALAVSHARSLQAEVRAILEAEAALGDRTAWVAWMDGFRAKMGLKTGPEAQDLQRESRDER
jgi:plasmid stability protein